MLIQEIKNDIYVWFIDNRNIVRAFDCDTNKWDQMKVFALDQKYKHYILSPEGSFLVCFKYQYEEDAIYLPKEQTESNDEEKTIENNTVEKPVVKPKTLTGRIQIHTYLLSEQRKLNYKIHKNSLTGYETKNEPELNDTNKDELNSTNNILLPKLFSMDTINLNQLFIQTTQKKDAFLLCTISNENKLLFHPLRIQVSDQRLKILKRIENSTERRITKLDYMEYMVEKFGSRAAIYWPSDGKLYFHTTYIMK
eukprot:345053_1